MTEVAVTGAAGQLGRAVIGRLLERGVAVRAYDRCAFPDAPCPASELDLAEAGPEFAWPHSVGTVLHLAGFRNPVESGAAALRALLRANLESAAAALTACTERVRHFVLVSSMSVYGPSPVVPTPELEPAKPDTLYGLSKRLGEDVCRVFGIDHPSCAVTILRLAQVYGPGSPEHLAIYRLIRQGLETGNLALSCPGDLKRDFLYLGDAAEAIARVAASPAPGIFNVGGGRPVSMLELAETVAAALDGPSSIRFGSQPGPDLVLDARAFAERFGFRPSVTLAEGIRREVARLAASAATAGAER